MTTASKPKRMLRDRTVRTGPVLALIAVLCNLLTVPMIRPLWQRVVVEGQWEAAFGFIFPALSVAVLIWALRKNLRLLVHGVSTFEVESEQAMLGEPLRGRFRNARKSRMERPIVAELCCKRQVSSGSGESSSSYTTTLWTGSQRFDRPPYDLREGIEIDIRVPAGLPASKDSTSDSTVIWELWVTAPCRPISLGASFYIDVNRRNPE